MKKTATLSPAQQAAQLCYRLYTSPLDKSLITEEGLAALCTLLGSPMSADEIIQLGTKFRQNADYHTQQQQIVSTWGKRAGANGVFGEQDAKAFILEIFGGLDHAFIYDHGITASSTLVRHGLASDSERQFQGKMPCWTLHFTVRGKALFLNEHMEVEVNRGDMMLLHPEAQYHYGLHPASDHWEHLWVLFQPRPHWSEWMEWIELDDGIFHLSRLGEDSVVLLENLFRKLIALKHDSSPFKSDLQHNRLEEILIHSKKYSAMHDRQKIDKRVQIACEYMHAHLAQKLSIDNIAAACNLSPSRIAHLFKTHMGISPKAWCNNMRLQEARKLLLASNDSINLVAGKVGYEDTNQFSKYFKKSMGCSPREFRRSFKGAAT
jgi:AraC family transcriptional regulator of arabinose operon